MRTRICTGYDVPTVLQQVDDEIAAGLRPTLALVFCSVAHDFSSLGRRIAERGMAVVGATTSGEIANARVLEEACVVMLMEMAPDAFAVQFATTAHGETLEALARHLGQFAVERFAHPVALVFASGVSANGEEVVVGIRAGTGRAIPLFGGMAGDDLIMKNTFVFSGTDATDEGLIGLVLDGNRFKVEGIATNGWQPIGIEKTVTRSEGNVVFTIDDEPALDVYTKYLGQRQNIIEARGVLYPLSVRRPNGTTVIRAPILYDPEREAMIFAGSVPEGAQVKFCIPPSMDIAERVVEEAKAVHQCLPHADALILVSCTARHLALGPIAEDEIQGLYDLWNAPMLGYFSYGEIGAREPQHCDFHTETCILVALREDRA